jgi:hypothetical protein
LLEPEVLQAALFAAAGEVQTLVNQLGLAARSAPTARLVFESDLRAALRHALQFGRQEMASVETPLGKTGVLAMPTDVVVASRTRTPQLAVEVQWHPRGEDHAGFVIQVMGDLVKMAVAKTRDTVEQAAILVGAPPRFWRWLPGYSQDRAGYELLNPDADNPATAKSEFLAGSSWDPLFAAGLDEEVPDRLWAGLLDLANVRSPWADVELHLLEVKGLGALTNVREA